MPTMDSDLSPEDRRAILHASAEFAMSLQKASAAIAAFAMESRELSDARQPGRTLARDLGDVAVAQASIRSRPVKSLPLPARRVVIRTPTCQEVRQAELHIASLQQFLHRPGERARAERSIRLITQSLECRVRAAEAVEVFARLAQGLRSQLR